MDPSAHRLYIARSNRVQVLDLVTEALVGEVANTQGVHGVALSLRRGYASNGQDNSVTVFDLHTLKEIDRIKVGTRPDCIVFDPASNRVFTMNAGSHDATAIDATANKVVGTVALGGKPEFAVSDRGSIFVNIQDKSEIVQFDSKTLSVKNRWPLAPGIEPSGLAIDPRKHRLFSVCSNEMMAIMDIGSGRVVAAPAIGKDRMPPLSTRRRDWRSARMAATER